MKKTYEKPTAEKFEFCYREQVVASGGDRAGSNYILGCPIKQIAQGWGVSGCERLPFSLRG